MPGYYTDFHLPFFFFFPLGSLLHLLVVIWILKSVWNQAYLCGLIAPYQLAQGHKKCKFKPLRCFNLSSSGKVPGQSSPFCVSALPGVCVASSVCGHKACKELWSNNWFDTAHARNNLSFIFRPLYITGTFISFSLALSGFLDCFSYGYVQHCFFQNHFHLHFSFMYKEKNLKQTNRASAHLNA